jgi:hypothetical protein
MYNLSNLSPEEKDQLLMQLLQKYDAGDAAPEAVDGHTDEAADLEMLEPFKQVLEALVCKVEELEERVGKTESMIIDDLFGGIDRLYKQNVRSQGIDNLSSKYGEMFNPHIDVLKELSPEDAENFWPQIYDLVEQMKGGDENYPEEHIDNAMKSAAQTISDKIAKIRGTSVEAPEGKGVAVEKTKVEAIPASGADENFLNRVRQMKSKAQGVKGIF